MSSAQIDFFGGSQPDRRVPRSCRTLPVRALLSFIVSLGPVTVCKSDTMTAPGESDSLVIQSVPGNGFVASLHLSALALALAPATAPATATAPVLF